MADLTVLLGNALKDARDDEVISFGRLCAQIMNDREGVSKRYNFGYTHIGTRQKNLALNPISTRGTRFQKGVPRIWALRPGGHEIDLSLSGLNMLTGTFLKKLDDIWKDKSSHYVLGLTRSDGSKCLAHIAPSTGNTAAIGAGTPYFPDQSHVNIPDYVVEAYADSNDMANATYDELQVDGNLQMWGIDKSYINKLVGNKYGPASVVLTSIATAWGRESRQVFDPIYTVGPGTKQTPTVSVLGNVPPTF